ncbi:MAG: two-component sensor histidine kinase [Anaerolineae bacterium]|nr:two-component sensor histidine kinase [Anaerolineae bacterium]
MLSAPGALSPEKRPDIREERVHQLRVMTRATLLGAPVMALVAFALSVASDASYGLIERLYSLVPLLSIVLGARITQKLLDDRQDYDRAALTFVVSFIVAIVMAMLLGAQAMRVIAPFVMVLVASLAGLLLPPLQALGLTIAGGIWILGYALIVRDSNYDIGALFLVAIAAAIAKLTSGSLYDSMAWAMESYRRSQERAEELWRNREELRKALAARDWLNEQLQATNVSLEEARQVADEANRLKTQFVANMSHELRSPLNAIINFTRIVGDGYAGEVVEEQRTYLEYVRLSGEHLLGLINDILDLAKVEAGKLEIHPEALVLTGVFKGVMSTAVGLSRDKGLALEQDIEEDLPLVWADPKRVRQVLLNLLGNAAKFTDEGSITLHAHCQNASEVCISIQDTGIGIAEDDFDKVFAEYQQVGNAHHVEGTGLGIPLSKRLIEMQGGRMWLESQLGVGTQFFFTLPVADASMPDSSEGNYA